VPQGEADDGREDAPQARRAAASSSISRSSTGRARAQHTVRELFAACISER
jgi:hypothetical protein